MRENLQRCGFAASATVVRDDARRWWASLEGDDSPVVDLALLDPPYAYDGWDDLLAVVRARVVVVESDRSVAWPERYELRRERRHGTTVVAIAELQESRS